MTRRTKRKENEARFDSVRNVTDFSLRRFHALKSITSIDDVCGFYQMTQVELSNRIGISRRTISNVKHFKCNAGNIFISKLCKLAPDEVGYWLPNFIALYGNKRGR